MGANRAAYADSRQRSVGRGEGPDVDRIRLSAEPEFQANLIVEGE